MRPPWYHWLAALALVAVLGPGPGPAADAPPGPGPKAPAGLDPLRRDQQDIDNALERLAQERDRLRERERLYARVVASASDPVLVKLQNEIEALKRTIAEAEAKKAKLEEELRTAEAKQAEAAGPHIKVFHLSRLDPNEMAAVLATLLPGRARFGAAARRGGAGGAGGGFGGGGPPGGGVAAPGGVGGFGGIGGFAPAPGFGGFGAPSRLRVAADARTHSLIARGSDADLQTAADLIAALDGDDGKPAPRLKDARVFRLRYARPEEVQGILNTLEIGARVAALPDARLLVAYGPESALKEVGEVVEAVDVATPPAPKPGKPGGKR